MIVQYKKILTSILFVLISIICSAQNGAGGGDMPPPPQGSPPPGLPIDNGLIFLLVLAVIYGIYKSLKLSKQP